MTTVASTMDPTTPSSSGATSTPTTGIDTDDDPPGTTTQADDSTGAEESSSGSSGAPAACGDGIAEPGELCFDMITTLASFCPPSHLEAGDMDGNGAIDLLYAAADDAEVHVFLGNDEGDFAAGSTDAINEGIGSTWPIALGRFSPDDDPDLALITAASAVRVLINDGNGTINNNFIQIADAGGDALSLGDLNGDDFDDILVVGDGSNAVYTILASGDGGFLAAQRLTQMGSVIRTSVVALDLNGNASLDFAIADLTNNQVRACLGDGSGGAVSCAPYDVDTWPVDIATGDLDGDGNQDIVTANTIGGSLSWLAGQGNGGFDEAVTIDAASGVNAVEVVDLNLDGFDDVAYIHPEGAEIMVRLFDPDAGTLGDAVTWTHGSGRLRDIISADFNGDGLPDLAAGNEQETTVVLLLSDA